MSAQTVHIAMWSGPRNISTAMLRSWGSRADTFVCDEPLYAHYLATTGLDHPGRDEVLLHHQSDWRVVVEHLTGQTPTGAPVFYQKHMAHHLVGDIDEAWVVDLRNCFLIRDPGAMLVSLAKVLPHTPTVEETGLPQQWRLFERLRDAGQTPPVIDSADVLSDPAGLLERLCERLGVPWDDAMLHWKPGPRKTDGVWAKHWYANVEASTGFGPPRDDQVDVPASLRDVHAQCSDLYNALSEHRMT